MVTVGLIVNPQAGKDIRRLVAWGSIFGNREKITVLIRFLQGFLGVTRGSYRFVYMPDPYGLVEVTLKEATIPGRLSFDQAPIPVFGDASDTLRFTEWAVEEVGVSALVTLGGDGTNRIVAKKSRDVPLFALSCGTNNVFAEALEPTLAGMALGAFFEGKVEQSTVLRRCKMLRCFSETREDIALVDVVFVTKHALGTKAVWEPETICFIAVTQSSPLTIGLSAVVGQLVRIVPEERRGACVWIGESGRSVLAPLAPGLVREVLVEECRLLEIGDVVEIPEGSGALALDGEREILVRPGERWWVRLEGDGPVRADMVRILELSCERGEWCGKGSHHAEAWADYGGRGHQ
ncbi:NAD(+)/NADH kinase [Candidatus Caldatribacterium sp.]|uniref:NAD(+)/NADH kinase n=1 Tax=Candidatus Caldatribacterium sp. TaxID=2282143 RepID=UPI002995B9AC|nr:NAD(+)/NADH kinase [Candidatus Caldatribacterium sp.]MDW8081084.1 NAD(+)/NADH kinase [Candidatus Calescibacterium sp.]